MPEKEAGRTHFIELRVNCHLQATLLRRSSLRAKVILRHLKKTQFIVHLILNMDKDILNNMRLLLDLK